MVLVGGLIILVGLAITAAYFLVLADHLTYLSSDDEKVVALHMNDMTTILGTLG